MNTPGPGRAQSTCDASSPPRFLLLNDLDGKGGVTGCTDFYSGNTCVREALTRPVWGWATAWSLGSRGNPGGSLGRGAKRKKPTWPRNLDRDAGLTPTADGGEGAKPCPWAQGGVTFW